MDLGGEGSLSIFAYETRIRFWDRTCKENHTQLLSPSLFCTLSLTAVFVNNAVSRYGMLCAAPLPARRRWLLREKRCLYTLFVDMKRRLVYHLRMKYYGWLFGLPAGTFLTPLREKLRINSSPISIENKPLSYECEWFNAYEPAPQKLVFLFSVFALCKTEMRTSKKTTLSDKCCCSFRYTEVHCTTTHFTPVPHAQCICGQYQPC